MSEPFVEVTRTGAAAVITFRREAKLNALSTAVEAQLGDALEHPDVRSAPVVVITGGPRAFSAGADVNEMGDMDPAAILAYYRQTGGVYERVARMPQPTIAAISGYCIGGGFELALATDFRVADDSAVFGLPEVAIGILPSSGGTLRLVRHARHGPREGADPDRRPVRRRRAPTRWGSSPRSPTRRSTARSRWPSGSPPSRRSPSPSPSR